MSIMRTMRSPLLVSLALVSISAAACSSSSSPNASPATTALTLARGGLSCTTITGSLTFSPPLTTKGVSPESTAIALTATGCTTEGSNVTNVTGGSGSATITSPTNSCTGLLNSRAIKIDLAWTPPTIRQSVLTFSGYAGASSSGNEGFTLPNAGGTAKVTGSFAGSDHGAGSTAATFSNQTGMQLLTACGSSSGLTSLQVTSGTLILK